MNSVHTPASDLYSIFLKITKLSKLVLEAVFLVLKLTSILQGCTFKVMMKIEEPGSSESTAERGEKEEPLRHFVPVNMLSEITVERMKKMEGRGRRRQGLVVHYCNECNYATHSKSHLVRHSRTHS